MWMLHIMDFDERDDFNTPLLQISALLGLILALTGLIYWALTTRVLRRRKLDQLSAQRAVRFGLPGCDPAIRAAFAWLGSLPAIGRRCLS